MVEDEGKEERAGEGEVGREKGEGRDGNDVPVRIGGYPILQLGGYERRLVQFPRTRRRSAHL